MDPKLLQQAGIDPKMLAMMDPRMMGGMDLKALSQIDPKLLQAAGIDPSMLSKMLDPKALAGMDPKVLASMGIDPKMFEQPKAKAPTPMSSSLWGLTQRCWAWTPSQHHHSHSLHKLLK